VEYFILVTQIPFLVHQVLAQGGLRAHAKHCMAQRTAIKKVLAFFNWDMWKTIGRLQFQALSPKDGCSTRSWLLFMY
jgi:hypothetical protein